MRLSSPTAAGYPSILSSTPAERRSRTRLRDLCDEVLASYRAASAREVITEQDRSEGRDFLAKIVRLSK